MRFNEVHHLHLRTIQWLKGFSFADAHFFEPGVGIQRQSIHEDEYIHDDEQEGFEHDTDSDESEGEDEEAEADQQTEAVDNS